MGSLVRSHLLHVSEIIGAIVNSAMKVHSLLVQAFWKAPIKPASHANSESADSQSPRRSDCRVVYDGEKIERGYRMDLVVEGIVVVEVKCVEAMHPIHEAQLLSYMRLSGIGVGLLINFHVLRLRDGIKRMVNGQDWKK